jgi:hypothetical protein
MCFFCVASVPSLVILVIHRSGTRFFLERKKSAVRVHPGVQEEVVLLCPWAAQYHSFLMFDISCQTF